MANLQAVIGLRGARLFPVTKDDTTGYETDPVVLLPHAQELTKADSSSEYTIVADDGIYASGATIDSAEINLTVAELDPQLEAAMQGAVYDSTKKMYSFKSVITPMYALGFACQRMDEEYKMFLYHCCRLMSIEISHKTKPAGSALEIQPYILRFKAVPRKYDNVLRDVADSDDKTFQWLDVVEQKP